MGLSQDHQPITDNWIQLIMISCQSVWACLLFICSKMLRTELIISIIPSLYFCMTLVKLDIWRFAINQPKSVSDRGCSLSSGTLTQAIRNFAKSLEGWLTNAMTNFPQEIIRTKVWKKKSRILLLNSFYLVDITGITLLQRGGVKHLLLSTLNHSISSFKIKCIMFLSENASYLHIIS